MAKWLLALPSSLRAVRTESALKFPRAFDSRIAGSGPAASRRSAWLLLNWRSLAFVSLLRLGLSILSSLGQAVLERRGAPYFSRHWRRVALFTLAEKWWLKKLLQWLRNSKELRALVLLLLLLLIEVVEVRRRVHWHVQPVHMVDPSGR